MTMSEAGGSALGPENAPARANALKAHPSDNVAVALRLLDAGEVPVFGDGYPALQLREAIPLGHKLALAPIDAGAPVVKFGETIGYATAAIDAGAHVHLHNLEGVSQRAARSTGEA